jgi:hypothetical protein
MTATYLPIRDLSELVWIFGGDLPAGFEGFGETVSGGRVVVRGKFEGQVAMDWLRDNGVEVVKG